jgi:hypothetical protein
MRELFGCVERHRLRVSASRRPRDFNSGVPPSNRLMVFRAKANDTRNLLYEIGPSISPNNKQRCASLNMRCVKPHRRLSRPSMPTWRELKRLVRRRPAVNTSGAPIGMSGERHILRKLCVPIPLPAAAGPETLDSEIARLIRLAVTLDAYASLRGCCYFDSDPECLLASRTK